MRPALAIFALLALGGLSVGCASDSGSPSPQPVSRAAEPPKKVEPPKPTVTPEFLARLDAGFVWVPNGTLPARWRTNDRKDPEAKVQGLWLAKYEVTQREWQTVMGDNPSQQTGDPELPVTNVSWHDAKAFIERLNKAKGAKVYRLPSAAEWESGCRAGVTTLVIPNQAKEESLSQFAWWGKNSGGVMHPVGKLKPNAFGLHDMLGNIAEWCEDAQNPPQKDILRVHAGGHFSDLNMVGQNCSTTAWMGEEGRERWTGFRLAKDGPPPAPKAKAKG